MKLFENSVGRPSNEIKRKRKIFIASAIALCIVLVFVLTKVSTNRLKGAAASGNTLMYHYASYWDVHISNCYLVVPVKIFNNSGNVLNITGAKLTDKDNKTYKSISYSKEIGKAQWQNVTYKFPIVAAMPTNVSNYRLVTYFKVGKKEYYKTEFFDITPNIKTGIDKCKTASSGGSGGSSVTKLTLKCPESGEVNKNFKCSTNQSGVKITVGGAQALATPSTFTTTSSNMSKDIKYTNTLFNGNWTINKDSKGKEYVTAKVTASKSGQTTVTKYVKIYKPASSNNSGNSTSAPKTLKLKCPEKSETNKSFKCTTDQAGVTITLGGAKSLAAGYSSSFTTTANDKAKDIKYADKLFTDYKSIIKKDSNGQYINAQVTASKSGYTTVTKNVKIYKASTSAKPLKLSCTDKVNSGSKAICYVTSNGKAISGAALSLPTSEVGTIKKDSKASNKYLIVFNDKLFTKYKSQIQKNSNGKQYIRTIITAKLKGYTSSVDYINVYKVNKSNEKESTSSSNIAKYSVSYSVTKVTKTGDKGEKKLDFKINDFGSDVKYVKHAICFERDACIEGDSSRYKGVTDLATAKRGKTYSLNITTPNVGLLNQDFYIRTTAYKENKEAIYYKINHFHTNSVTSSSSKNKNVSDEKLIKIGDFTNTTQDFLFSSKMAKVSNPSGANYGVVSVKKLSNPNKDNEIRKLFNVIMKNFGEDVKYVSFVVCNKLEDCEGYKAIDKISLDAKKGSVLLYQVPERGKEYPIEVVTKSEKMLNQKIYVRIYAYLSDKTLISTKLHEFTTGKTTKSGVKKDSQIKVGDRVIAENPKLIESEELEYYTEQDSN